MFEKWFSEVDKIVEETTGVSIHDLRDYCWIDLFEDGFSSQDAAEEFILNSGDF